VLVGDNFVVGCKDALKGVGLSSVVTISGKLKGRSIGGASGLGPIELTGCQFIK